MNFRLFKSEQVVKVRDERIRELEYQKTYLETTKKEQAKTIESLLKDKNFLLKV